MKVGIEHAHLGDALDRQAVALGGLADRLRRRAVVDAEGALLVGRDVGVQPGHAELAVVADHRAGGLAALLGRREAKAVGNAAFDDIERHGFLAREMGSLYAYPGTPVTGT